jgi:hypothetical protein
MGYREVKTNCSKIYSLKVGECKGIHGDSWKIEGVYGPAFYDNFGLNKKSVVQKYIIDHRQLITSKR